MSDAKQQAAAQCRAIVEMVAALECDYGRLEELREAVSDYCDESPLQRDDAAYKWRAENPDDAAELADLTEAAGDCESEDDARQRIDEDPLSIEVRSDWTSPGETLTAGEARIVLCTGGPHVELRFDVAGGSPSGAVRVHWKDWGESGGYYPGATEREALAAYVNCFFFGE